MLKLISFFILFTLTIYSQGFHTLGILMEDAAASIPIDTGFYKFDAEDGLANLTLTNGEYITDTSGFSYAGSKSYKFRGAGGAINVYADVTAFPSGYGNEDTIWVTYRIYIPASSTSNETSNSYGFLTLLGSGGDVNGDNGYWCSGTDGSGNINSWAKPQGTVVSTNFSTNAWHKVEIKYIQGIGDNATDSVYVDETPAYGTTTGAGTSDTDGFRFGYYNWVLSSGDAIYFDDIIFSKQRLPLD